MLEIKVEHWENATILRCAGQILFGSDIVYLRNHSMSQGRRILLLDLTRVDRIDAAGLGILVFLRNWAQFAGVELKIANPREHVQDLLRLTRLDSVLDISEREESVAAGF